MSRDIPSGSPPDDEHPTDADGGSVPGRAAVDDLRTRLAAVERACSGDADVGPADLGDAAEATAELQNASERIDELEDRVAELESATKALRGYVGSIRAVNERVERRADRALAASRAGPSRERQATDRSAAKRPAAERLPGESPNGSRPVEGAPANDGEHQPDDTGGGDVFVPDDWRDASGTDGDGVSGADGNSTYEGSDREDAPGDDDAAPLVERLREAL
ncbi:DUF7310 family coiled-coil domain-containing protein [Halobaculum magnesiiphilum]|uniref:DUF7310 domain-containing protein n=1 Tax=Halobaculum magnesiiphilum TaxID=1017351 RepID=A0A8T8WCN3_9EURY|nr:hypothetical protein [Halobaculum magnesiiphilum]QZP37610.1 hypothetical protein K6T50_00040 [Halobaculum magnesiiphilum]